MEMDRLSIRSRPPGRPIMHQTWDKLLFLHWPMPADVLRSRLPPGLHLDTFGGTAWIGITPFTMPVIRPALLPALPIVGTSHELNVRTYVHYDGVPGVWFLSLDANNLLAVLGARLGFGLPYFYANITLEEQAQAIRFISRRRHPAAPPANLEVTWRAAEALSPAAPGSLAFFLIERYCLYAARGRHLYRTRIFHRPWPLRRAQLRAFTSTMLQAHGLPTPEAPPLLHGQAAPLHVDVWLPTKLS